MPRVSSILNDKVVLLAEEGLRALGTSGSIANKLRAIIAAKKHGIKKVAEVYDMSRTTLTTWIKNTDKGSIDALKAKPKKPMSPITAAHRGVVKGWLAKDNTLTINAVRIRIEEEFRIKIGKSSVHRLMKKIGFSYITPRPKHYKQNANLHDGFKKKSKRGT